MPKDVRNEWAQQPADRLTLRVYYEDTDFSGRVYHASYLRFLERGRTEWLRARGFEQRPMAAGESIVFVVHHLSIEFIKPATMDDLIDIETRVASLGAATVYFAQRVWRGEDCLATATVEVAALRAGRPARLPAEIRARLAGGARSKI
jgi:acyl-CoA thioester hydrolase